MSEHPFQVGAEVALCCSGGFNAPHYYRKSVVTKILGSGKFRVEGSDAQWRPHPPGHYEKCWHASAAGSSSGSLIILDEGTRERIQQENARAKRHRRYSDARYKLDRIKFSDRVTEEVLQELEDAISKIAPEAA